LITTPKKKQGKGLNNILIGGQGKKKPKDPVKGKKLPHQCAHALGRGRAPLSCSSQRKVDPQSVDAVKERGD